jgi:hypothetical protein
MPVTDRLQDGALGGSFGEKLRLVEAGRRIADIVPGDQRDRIRNHSDSVTVDAGMRFADLSEYTWERTPGGQGVSAAGDAADRIADGIGGLVDSLRDLIPSEGTAKAIGLFVAALGTLYVLGQLLTVNASVGGGQ